MRSATDLPAASSTRNGLLAGCLVMLALALAAPQPAFAVRPCTEAQNPYRGWTEVELEKECREKGFFPEIGGRVRGCPVGTAGDDFEACFGWLAGDDRVPGVGEPVVFCGLPSPPMDEAGREIADWCWKFRGPSSEGCFDLRERFPCVIYEEGGPAEVALEARRDLGISLQVANAAGQEFQVCQPRMLREEIIVDHTFRSEVLIPVTVPPTGLSEHGSGPGRRQLVCGWRLEAPTGSHLLDGSRALAVVEGQGEEEVWLQVRIPGQGRSLEIEAEGNVVPELQTPLSITGIDLGARRDILDRPEPPEVPTFKLPYFLLNCETLAGCGDGAPILVLPDGPGVSPEEYARDGRIGLLTAVAVAGDHPLVLVGVRGSDRKRETVPDNYDLRCPVQSVCPDPLGAECVPADEAIVPATLLDNASQASTNCRELRQRKTLAPVGKELDDFKTQEFVDDLEYLRSELFFGRRVILWGDGYGTQLALAYLKKYGAEVDAVVLHGPRPLDRTAVLPIALTQVLRQAGLLSMKGLESQIRGELNALDASPAQLTLPQPIEISSSRLLARVPATLGSLDLQQAVAWSLLDRRRLRALPAGLDALTGSPRDPTLIRDSISAQVAGGSLAGPVDCSLLGGPAIQARSVAVRGECLGSALSFVVPCAMRGEEETPDALQAAGGREVLGRALDYPYPEICDAWDVEIDTEFPACAGAACPDQAIPVLLIWSELDPYSRGGRDGPSPPAVCRDPEDVCRVETWLRDPQNLPGGVRVGKVKIVEGTRSDLFDPRLRPILEGFLADGVTADGAVEEVRTLPLFGTGGPSSGSGHLGVLAAPRVFRGARFAPDQVRLEWESPVQPGTVFILEARIAEGAWERVATMASSASTGLTIVSGLEPHVDYTFRIQARSASGARSPYSDGLFFAGVRERFDLEEGRLPQPRPPAPQRPGRPGIEEP